MSHYTRMRTALRDADVLAAALKEVGLRPVEVHDQPQPLGGYWGRGTAHRAEVIVRREHAAGAHADIGFARQPDGSFATVLDSMDHSRYGNQWLTRLTRAYGHAAALKYASEHGFEVLTDEAEHDGTRRLTLRRVSVV